MQNFCDIMPHATGWVYVVDGIQSDSSYHTYELALQAARNHIALGGGGPSHVFRRQALDGGMLPIPVGRAAYSGAASQALP